MAKKDVRQGQEGRQVPFLVRDGGGGGGGGSFFAGADFAEHVPLLVAEASDGLEGRLLGTCGTAMKGRFLFLQFEVTIPHVQPERSILHGFSVDGIRGALEVISEIPGGIEGLVLTFYSQAPPFSRGTVLWLSNLQKFASFFS